MRLVEMSSKLFTVYIIMLAIGVASAQDHLLCKSRSSPCFLRTLQCPDQCPLQVPTDPTAEACLLDCHTCEAICQNNEPPPPPPLPPPPPPSSSPPPPASPPPPPASPPPPPASPPPPPASPPPPPASPPPPPASPPPPPESPPPPPSPLLSPPPPLPSPPPLLSPTSQPPLPSPTYTPTPPPTLAPPASTPISTPPVLPPTWTPPAPSPTSMPLAPTPTSTPLASLPTLSPPSSNPTSTNAPPTPTSIYAPFTPTSTYAPPTPTSTYEPPTPTSAYEPPTPTSTYPQSPPSSTYTSPTPTSTYTPPVPLQGGGPSAPLLLKVNYYTKTCPNAEELVKAEMKRIQAENPTLMPALVRLHFHDCFVRGCDASVVLVSKNGTAEKDAKPNLSLRGFDAIERLKKILEEACPRTVSCADILAMAAREAIFLSNGPRYDVETGRRDGNTSMASEAYTNLPPATGNVTTLINLYASKNLTVKDLVVLSGAHTFGASHCYSFSDRLYNYSGTGYADPTLNNTYAQELRQRCTPGDTTTVVSLSPDNYFTFNLGYFKSVKNKEGLFNADEALLHNNVTLAYVTEQANANSPDKFFKDFAESMVHMGRVGVLTGTDGTIRNVCGSYVD